MNTNLWRLCLVGALCGVAACGSDDTGSSDTPSTNEDAGLRGDDVGGTRPDPPAPDIVEEEDTQPSVDTVDTGEEDTGPAPDTTPAPDVVDPGTSNCGNGIREFGEICDGEDFLPGASCVSVGFIGGDLGCSATCELSTDACYDELCGDGIISGTEECDGENIAEQTCATRGFAPNGEDAITCTSECRFDESECSDSICGNENIEDGFEICDGELFGGESCRSQGFFTGTLACTEECSEIDTSACVENVCGNGTIEGPEVCDGGLASVTCRDIEVPEGEGEFYAGGLIACKEDCFDLDLSGCVADPEELGEDTDGDGIPDVDDNCPDVPNPRQLDFTGNGVGNVCDDPITFSVLAPSTSPYIVATNGEPEGGGGGLGDLFGGIGPFELDLEVVSGSITFSLDDEGEITSSELTVQFGAQTIEIDPGEGGGGGLPIPIPIPIPSEPIEITISGASVTSATDEQFVVAGTAAEYLAGEIEGANTSFGIVGQISLSSAGTPVNATLAQSSTLLSLYDRSYTFVFSDATVVWAETTVSGGGLGIPGFDLPGMETEVQLIGLNGAVTFVAE